MVAAEFYAYVVQGFIIAASNGLLAYAILTSLRRNYTVIVWQVFVDALMGASQMMAGIARLITVYTNTQHLRSKQYCMLMPWNLVAVWGEPMVAICLLMVSIDRLLALTLPIIYYKESIRLQKIQIITWNLLMISIALISWCFSLADTNEILSPFCWTSDSMIPVFNSLTLFLTITASVSSVVLYVIVFIFSRKHANRLRDVHKDERYRSTFNQQQRQLTVTMGISCVFTLMLYVLPVCLKCILADRVSAYAYEVLQAYSAISCNLTPLTNMAVVVYRHNEIRRRLIHVLPSSLRNIFRKTTVVSTNIVTNYPTPSTIGGISTVTVFPRKMGNACNSTMS